MQRFIEGVRGRIVPLYATNNDDWTGYIVTMESIAGGVPISLKQQAESANDGDSMASVT